MPCIDRQLWINVKGFPLLLPHQTFPSTFNLWPPVLSLLAHVNATCILCSFFLYSVLSCGGWGGGTCSNSVSADPHWSMWKCQSRLVYDLFILICVFTKRLVPSNKAVTSHRWALLHFTLHLSPPTPPGVKGHHGLSSPGWFHPVCFSDYSLGLDIRTQGRLSINLTAL